MNGIKHINMDYEKKCNKNIVMTAEEKAKVYDESFYEKQKEQKVDIDKLRRDIYQSGYNDGYQHGKEDAQKEQKPVSYTPLCNTIKDKILEYVANHFVTDTVVTTDVKSIIKAMEEGVKLGKESQKPVEWSEEDDGMLLSIINAFRNGTVSTIGQEQWLKSLPKRFNLQSKQEWSEKEMRKIVELKFFITQCNGFNKENRKKVFDMIDALHPRSHWKPSEEQMSALTYFIKLWGNSDDQLEYTKIFNTVKSLRDDLEKQM